MSCWVRGADVLRSWLFLVCPLFQSPLPPTRSSRLDSFTCPVWCGSSWTNNEMESSAWGHGCGAVRTAGVPYVVYTPTLFLKHLSNHGRTSSNLTVHLAGWKNSSPLAWLSWTTSAPRVLPFSHALCSSHSKLHLLSKQTCPFASLLWTHCSFCWEYPLPPFSWGCSRCHCSSLGLFLMVARWLLQLHTSYLHSRHKREGRGGIVTSDSFN